MVSIKHDKNSFKSVYYKKNINSLSSLVFVVIKYKLKKHKNHDTKSMLVQKESEEGR